MKNSIQNPHEVQKPDTGDSKTFVACILFFTMACTILLSLYGCEDEIGSGNAPNKWAVKYKISGGETAITVDNSKELFRSDVWMSGIHIIGITDHKNKVSHSYTSLEGVWKTVAYTSTGSDQYTFKESDGTKVEKLADRTVAGKTCKSYKYTHKNGNEFIVATWKGIMMYQEDVNTGSKMEATSATVDVPASAFSQESIEVTWL